MPKLEVGDLYNPQRDSWPEAVQYLYRDGQHELLLFFENLDKKTIEVVRKGRMTIGLFVRHPCLLFLFRIDGACEWSDQPFTYHMLPEPERVTPPHDDGKFALLTVVLVQAETGIVKALRAVSMSREMTALLHDAIRKQAADHFDIRRYNALLDQLFNDYPDTKSMVKDAAIVEVAGRVG